MGTFIQSWLVFANIAQYLLYMLYFDWYNHHHFGSIRQQIWAILHFPLHLTLVLMVEGASQFIIWRKVVEVVNKIDSRFTTATYLFTHNSSDIMGIDVLQKSVNYTAYGFFNDYPPTSPETYLSVDSDIAKLGNASFTEQDTLAVVDHLYLTVQNSLFQSYGIKTPKVKYSVTDSYDTYNRNLQVFALVVSCLHQI